MPLAFPASVKRINVKGVYVFASRINTREKYLVEWYENDRDTDREETGGSDL